MKFRLGPFEDALPGGKGDDMPLSKFDPDEVAIGLPDETKEHGALAAPEVVADHLAGRPNYYSKGKTVEGIAEALLEWNATYTLPDDNDRADLVKHLKAIKAKCADMAKKADVSIEYLEKKVGFGGTIIQLHNEYQELGQLFAMMNRKHRVLES